MYVIVVHLCVCVSVWVCGWVCEGCSSVRMKQVRLEEDVNVRLKCVCVCVMVCVRVCVREFVKRFCEVRG